MNFCQFLIEGFSEGIIVLDQIGFVQYTNPAANVLTGYSDNELINKPLSVLYDNENDSIKVSYELDLAKKEGKYTAEGWKTKKDGKRFWAEIVLSPLFTENNTFYGYTFLLRDRSEKKSRELELRHSEERYRLMLERVKDYAIFMLDSSGNIATWNEGARITKGYSADEIIGKHFSTFYTLEDIQSKKPERELEIAKKTGKYEEEGWRVKKNGSLFWANVIITALYNEQDKLIGFSKVTRDLTERRESEERLRQNEERYRSLVEQVKDYGIFMMDEKGRIISWNEGAKKIKGYTASDIIGKYFSIFYPEEDIINGKPDFELKKARAEGKYEEEGWRLRKDGSRFWAHILITAIYNNKGVLIGFSKVTKDLTETKAAEKALRESYENYRLLATELKITNAELSYANNELEQFTSIASHDLQEPLRSIKSFLQLIEMKLNDKQYNSLPIYIGKTISAANRMRELIQNLLNYTQLDKSAVAKEIVDVEDLISSALQNLKTSIETAKASVTIENKLNTTIGDPVQLGQLLQNLLSNAIKFTDSRKPEIKISCFKENDYDKFAISDNGIGISEADQSKVFEIFKRLYTEKDYPGTGIGLAICKRIVERHRGRIWPESIPGKGTTFYFTLNEDLEPSQRTP